MAQPLSVQKKAVDLDSGPRRVGSRIRRAPPPKPNTPLTTADLRKRESNIVVVGMITFAVALNVIIFAAILWGA